MTCWAARPPSPDPDKGSSSSVYDDAGQLTSTTDARGVTLAYKYDSLGRKLEQRKDSLGGQLLASWAYDTIVKGQPASSTRYAQTGSGTAEAWTTQVTGYDVAYRPTGKRVTLPASLAPLDGDWESAMTYKPDGSPATVTLPSMPGIAEETLTYSYDSLGVPYELRSGLGRYVHDAAYTPFGELAQLQLGDAPKQEAQTFYYELGTHRLVQAAIDRQGDQTSQQPRPVQDLHYSYDPVGNLTSLADTPAAGLGNPERQCFTYDPLRRLNEAWTTTAAACGAPGASVGGPVPYWTSYTYDAVGNRRTDTTHAVSGVAAMADATRAYWYPAAGQPRPHAITTTSSTGTGTGSVGALSGTYAYDAAGATIAVRTGASLAAVSWLASDHHGTGTLAVNADTATATVRRADPFGNPRGPQPTWPGSRGFVGGVTQPTLGLTHLDAREYDPTLGRFVSVDPVLDPKDPQQFNACAYAANNPTTMSDPSGLFNDCGCPSDSYGYDNVLCTTPTGHCSASKTPPDG
jgi:RHS repeat-associated protein